MMDCKVISVSDGIVVLHKTAALGKTTGLACAEIDIASDQHRTDLPVPGWCAPDGKQNRKQRRTQQALRRRFRS